MKIRNITISNILSFPKIELLNAPPTITFNDDFTILIGPNGAGKSNLIEIVNYILNSFFLQSWNFNPTNGRVEMITNNFTTEKYLPPNFLYPNEPSNIILTIECTQKDIDAMKRLKSLHKVFEYEIRNKYFRDLFEKDVPFTEPQTLFYSIGMSKGSASYGLNDQTAYFHNFYNDLNRINSIIKRHNLINPDNQVEEFDYNYTIIPTERILENLNSEFSFGVDALEAFLSNHTITSAKEILSNSNQINYLFHLLGYEGRKLTRTMGRSFIVEQLSNNKVLQEVNKYLNDFLEMNLHLELGNTLADIIRIQLLKKGIEYNSVALSAGEKTILYYILTLCSKPSNSGFLIIDEPETNLHPQFHKKIKKFLLEYAKEKNIQLLLSTHSHNFLDQQTIPHCSRIIKENDYSKIYSIQNTYNHSSKNLIRIINNAGYQDIFFAKKVILVEGDSDQYFFKHILQTEYAAFIDTTEIIYIAGKHNHKVWMQFLSQFKIETFFIGDFDNVYDYSNIKKPTQLSPEDALNILEALYNQSIFILKQGDLEHYLNITKKGLEGVIDFINNDYENWKIHNSDKWGEINHILSKILGLDSL